MKALNRYSMVLFLSLSLLVLTQGCSFYAGFHTKSAPPSGTAMTQGMRPNERETPQTVSNQSFGDVVG